VSVSTDSLVEATDALKYDIPSPFGRVSKLPPTTSNRAYIELSAIKTERVEKIEVEICTLDCLFLRNMPIGESDVLPFPAPSQD